MKVIKIAKDHIIKKLSGPKFLPAGLFEMSQYFHHYEPIQFSRTVDKEGITVKSTNFQFGSIITNAKTEAELDEKIKDAILTSFDIPSSYKKEAKIHKVGEQQKEYAIA
ncbi:hypothetical protein HOB30_04220 [Candidatus Falkowbacteria bacterium]|jgi:hypothetical protein|nr:hypothetical protein [Candidatus Falkowbacteria bacterium]